MADEIGVFTPEQARLIWQDYQTRQQLVPQISQNFPQRRIVDEPSPHRVWVRNDSGETIPAYGCMQITGTVDVSGRTVVKVIKPNATDKEYLFNSQFEIADGGSGWAFRFGVVIMLGTAPTDPTQYRPIVASWNVEEGDGPFVVFGEHNAVSNALIGRIGAFPSGDGGVIEFKITSVTTKSSGPYIGLKAANVVIHGAPCSRSNLIGTTVEVIDHSNELFDETTMIGYTGWASEMVFWSLDSAADCETLTPCHWAAINRVCSPNTGIYDAACPPPE